MNARAMTIDMDDYTGPLLRANLFAEFNRWLADTGIGLMGCRAITFREGTVDLLCVNTPIEPGFPTHVVAGFVPSVEPPVAVMQWLARRQLEALA